MPAATHFAAERMRHNLIVNLEKKAIVLVAERRAVRIEGNHTIQSADGTYLRKTEVMGERNIQTSESRREGKGAHRCGNGSAIGAECRRAANSGPS